MSISALNSEAARLLAYFQGAESSIESRLNTAIQTVGTPGKQYFVDAIAGNDANAGAYSTPFLTIDKALSVIDGMDGRIVDLYLAQGNDPVQPVYTINAQYELHNCDIQIKTYTPAGRTTTPILLQGAGQANAALDMKGLWLHHSACVVIGIDVKTAETKVEGTTTSGMFRVRNYGAMSAVIFRTVGLTLGEAPAITTRRGFVHAGLDDVTVTRPTGTAQVLDIGSGGVASLSVLTATIPGGSAWKDDLVTGILRFSNGTPRNLLSNLDFSV